jgi:hypothetical protein
MKLREGSYSDKYQLPEHSIQRNIKNRPPSATEEGNHSSTRERTAARLSCVLITFADWLILSWLYSCGTIISFSVSQRFSSFRFTNKRTFSDSNVSFSPDVLSFVQYKGLLQHRIFGQDMPLVSNHGQRLALQCVCILK